jgi:plastocyanin
MRRVTTVLLLAILAACAGEGSTTTSEPVPPSTAETSIVTTGTTPTAESSSTSESPATPDTTIGGPTAEISISGFSFGSQQTVQVGTTVIATNNDPFTHTWSSVDDFWDSGNLRDGDSFAFTFDEAGTYSFICRIHPGEMGGSIVVEG